jgi:hypothetical protein
LATTPPFAAEITARAYRTTVEAASPMRPTRRLRAFRGESIEADHRGEVDRQQAGVGGDVVPIPHGWSDRRYVARQRHGPRKARQQTISARATPAPTVVSDHHQTYTGAGRTERGHWPLTRFVLGTNRCAPTTMLPASNDSTMPISTATARLTRTGPWWEQVRPAHTYPWLPSRPGGPCRVRQAGLVRSRNDGPFVDYSIVDQIRRRSGSASEQLQRRPATPARRTTRQRVLH